jgi:excisionase family DNA binding protein
MNTYDASRTTTVLPASGFDRRYREGASLQGGSVRRVVSNAAKLNAQGRPTVSDAETGRNSTTGSDVEDSRFPARDAVAKRKLRVLKADDAADPPRSLAEQLEKIAHALTANNLAQLLQVSEVTIYKLAKTNRLPSFRIGTAVRL